MIDDDRDTLSPRRLNGLLPAVYDHLRRIARKKLSEAPGEQTLQATALVHEAYMRLAGNPAIKLEDEEHLKAAAAQAIHWVLVDRARRRLTARRGAGERPVPLEFVDPAHPLTDAGLVALDDSLRRLERFDRRKYEVVILMYFGGLTIDESGNAIGISPATVKRDWNFARAWLLADLQDHE